MKPITFPGALELFLVFLKEKKRSSNTILAYKTDLDQLVAALGEKGIDHPTAVNQKILEEVKADYQKKGYTLKSISRKLNAYRTFFSFLKNKGFIEEDVTLGVAYPQTEMQPPRILTPMEYRALRDSVRGNNRLAAIVEVLLQTGLRISELSNLRLEDIKADSLAIQALESQPARTVPLNKPAREALDIYLRERPKSRITNVFITNTGRKFLIRNIREVIKRHLLAAGVKDASVNDLRHTFIAHHLENGVPLPVLAKIAGHKRLSTTERYLKFVKVQTDKPTKLGEL